jgi:hypothetical protein
VDHQEHMIAAGCSPYSTKYGHAEFAGHRVRYTAAERAAQAAHVGGWDQVTVNGSEMRNYARLGVWWALRAALVDDHRRRRADDPDLLDSRLDHDRLAELAGQGAQVTVFTELAGYTRVGGAGPWWTSGPVPSRSSSWFPTSSPTRGRRCWPSSTTAT